MPAVWTADQLLARGILRNDGEAEYVVQETYVRAFTHLSDFRGESSLSTWVSRIAMNEALGRLRRERPGVELSSLPQGMLEARSSMFESLYQNDPSHGFTRRDSETPAAMWLSSLRVRSVPRTR